MQTYAERLKKRLPHDQVIFDRAAVPSYRSAGKLEAHSRQAFATVVWSVPRQAASRREDQCVAPSLIGGGRSAAATIERWPIRPCRASLLRTASPSIPKAAWQARHANTVVRLAPTFSAMSVLGTPSAVNSTIRARLASTPSTEVERTRRVSSPGHPPAAEAGPQHDWHNSWPHPEYCLATKLANH